MIVYKISAKNYQSGNLGYVHKIIRGFPYYTHDGREYTSIKWALNALDKCNEYKIKVNKMCQNDDFEFKIETITKGE